MDGIVAQIDKFHKTTAGLLAFGLVELALAYGFALWAIDDGSVWLYLITLALVAGVIQNCVKLIGRALQRYGKARRTR